MDLYTAGSLDSNFILELYQRAFPEVERKPFSLIERKAVMGSMEILAIKEGKQKVGLAITAMEEELVLLDYFAIAEEFRGQGEGSEALMLLQALYSDKCLFLEIEEPDEMALNQEERLRRKRFYLKNRMQETGIHIELFGVPMEILAAKPGLTYERCKKLYRALYGPMYQKAVKLVEEKEAGQ